MEHFFKMCHLKKKTFFINSLKHIFETTPHGTLTSLSPKISQKTFSFEDVFENVALKINFHQKHLQIMATLSEKLKICFCDTLGDRLVKVS